MSKSLCTLILVRILTLINLILNKYFEQSMIKYFYLVISNRQMKDFVVGKTIFLTILIGWLIKLRSFYLLAGVMYRPDLLSILKVSRNIIILNKIKVYFYQVIIYLWMLEITVPLLPDDYYHQHFFQLEVNKGVWYLHIK